MIPPTEQPSDPSQRPGLEIHGREAELDVLAEQVTRAQLGDGSVTLLSAPPGLGKSRLIDEVVGIATRAGVRVACSVAERGDRVVPMNLLIGALSDRADPVLPASELAGLRASPESDFWQILELESLLEHASRAKPILICLDDLQWADHGTVAAIDALTARLSRSAIAWVLSYRPAELPAEALATVSRLEGAGASLLEPGPLSHDAVFRIVADRAGGDPDEALLSLAESARGAPFWLTELLAGLREEGRIEVAGGRARLVVDGLPLRVTGSMRDRLARMSPLARSAASAASVLGRRFSYDALMRMLDAGATALLEPVDELVAADLLVAEGDTLGFRHDILRDAVLDAVLPAARRALQRQAVDVLLAVGSPPAEVAAQLADSAEPGDSEAVDILTRAARTIGASDPTAGASLTRRALELLEPGDAREGPLVADTALLLHAAGQLDDGRLVAENALRELLPVDQESEVRFSIAGMFTLSADVRAEAGRQALALPGLSDADRARHTTRLIHNLLTAGRPIESRRLLDEVGHDLRASDDPAILFPLTLAEAGLVYAEGRFEPALALVEHAIRYGPSGRDRGRLHAAQNWRSEFLGVLDRYDEAVAICAEGLGAARRDRQGWSIRQWELYRGWQLFQLGELSDAIAQLEGMFHVETARLRRGANEAGSLGTLARAALCVGDARLSAACAELVPAMQRDGTPEARRHCAWILAQQAAARGNPAEARDLLLAVESSPERVILPIFPLDVTDEPELIRIALAAGDRDMATRAGRRAEERARLNPGVGTISGIAAHARGLLNADSRELALAVDRLQRGPRRLAAASACEDAGVLAVNESRTGDAVALLGIALERYTAIGAGWHATRVRSRLRRLGVRRRLISAGAPTEGWESLTDAERKVVAAVAGGMTDREAATHLFLSPHTVNSHLRRVYAKLGISSRRELTRLAQRSDREP